MARKRDGTMGAGLEAGCYSKEAAKSAGIAKMSDYPHDGQSARLPAGKRLKSAGDGKHKFK